MKKLFIVCAAIMGLVTLGGCNSQGSSSSSYGQPTYKSSSGDTGASGYYGYSQ